MAMRARAIVAPQPVPSRHGRHGAKCNVVSILSASAAMQGHIEKAMREPLDDELRTLSSLRYWTAFVQLKCHEATLEVWTPLCEALNIGMLLCEDDIGADYLELFIAAQDAAFRAWMRGERTGSYRLDGQGITAITMALAVADAQLEVAHRGDLARAERIMIARLNAGDTFAAEPIAA